MTTKIFVNLPVKDLNRSMEFYWALGYSFEPQFTDETAACMIVSDDIYVMLLTHEKFAEFSPSGIADPAKGSEVLVALSCDSREEVDATFRKAIDAGGTSFREPMDFGFMYGQSFQDLDGHVWEIFFMEPSAVPQPVS